MGHPEGDEVPEPLDLVDDRVRVGHFGSVIEGRRAVGADHLLNLLLDSLCDVWVLEHEQEAVAEGGAGGLGAGEEEREHGEDEVLVVELAAWVGLVFFHAEQVDVDEIPGVAGGPGLRGASLRSG